MTLAGGALDPQGPVAAAIAALWWLMLAIGAAVFLLFAVLLVLGLRHRDDDADGNTRGQQRAGRWIIGGGVILPTVVLVVVFGATVYAMRVLPSAAPPGALEVKIVGHQWWYEVRYPE